MLKKIITLSVCLLPLTLINAKENQNNIKIADEYLEAYKVFDVKKMASFYQEDSVFIDPTSEIFGPKNTYTMKGQKVIVDTLSKLIEQTGGIVLDFDLKHKYEAGGHVTFIADLKLSSGKGDNLTTACAPITTIINIKEGKVIEHRDYFSYNQYMKTHKKGDQACSGVYQ
jgi:ketosteroid isomerase-like protein